MSTYHRHDFCIEVVLLSTIDGRVGGSAGFATPNLHERRRIAMNEPGTHKLTEAMKGPTPADTAPAGSSESGPPESTPGEVAEETRREQEARAHEPPDRDDFLTSVGRGQQTHG
jgi:hypothetical protein